MKCLQKVMSFAHSRPSVVQNVSVSSVFCSTKAGLSDKSKSEKVQVEEIQTIKVERSGKITLIGINRPEVRNCIDSSTADQLTRAIQTFEEDPDSPVGVLYGVGGTFCAGYDLKQLSEGGVDPKKAFTQLVSKAEGSIGPTRLQTKKPLVAAIDGYCVAGGFEIALMCDLRVMEENAFLGVLNRRFGVPLIDGGTVRLPAIVGLTRALDLVLTGRQVAAREAFDMGLVNRVVAIGAALGNAINLANCIAKFPPYGLKHDRDCTYYGAFDAKNFRDAMTNEVMTCSKELFEEAIRGAAKFSEGVGRHGKFHDISERERPDWERDEIAREKAREEESKQHT